MDEVTFNAIFGGHSKRPAALLTAGLPLFCAIEIVSVALSPLITVFRYYMVDAIGTQ